MDDVRDALARDQVAQPRAVGEIVDHLRGRRRPRIEADRRLSAAARRAMITRPTKPLDPVTSVTLEGCAHDVG